SEQAALETITLNGAKQIGLEKRIGSIEVGKDGDLAIFNGHPLNSYARCEMSLVEGEIYFQRSEKLTPFADAATPPATPVKDFTPIKASPDGSYLLKNLTIHPATGPVVKGNVLIRKGKIVAVGKEAAADEKQGIECSGLHLYPGMIDAATVL